MTTLRVTSIYGDGLTLEPIVYLNHHGEAPLKARWRRHGVEFRSGPGWAEKDMRDGEGVRFVERYDWSEEGERQ